MYAVYIRYVYIHRKAQDPTNSTEAPVPQTFLSALRKYPEAKRVGAISLGFFGGESTKVGNIYICIYGDICLVFNM